MNPRIINTVEKIVKPKSLNQSIKSSSSNSILKTSHNHDLNKSQSNKKKNSFSKNLENFNENNNIQNNETTENNQEIQGIDQFKREIKKKVFMIFANFAKFSSTDNDLILSQQNLIKILKYSSLIDQKRLKIADIEVILKRVSKTGTKINQNEFLDFLAQIAFKCNPLKFKENPKAEILELIETYLDPFLQVIDQNTNSEIRENQTFSQNSTILFFLEKFTISDSLLLLLHNMQSALKEVYISYFRYEVNEYPLEKIIKESLRNFIEFCNDFEISPYLLNSNQVYCYWSYINGLIPTEYNPFQIYEKDLGKFFTLSHFALSFVHFSMICYEKLVGEKKVDNETDKFLLFCEKIENTKGFQNLERRTNRPHYSRITFLPDKNKEFVLQEDSQINQNKNENDSKILIDLNRKSQLAIPFDIDSLLKSSPDVKQKINEKYNILNDIFLVFSQQGDKLSFNKMNFSGFLKFLKEINVVNTSNTGTQTNDIFKNTKKSQTRFNESPSTRSFFSSKKASQAYLKNGKIIESEAFCIFSSLTGYQNFDNSLRIKSQFDRNKGCTLKMGETIKDANLNKKSSLTYTKCNVPMKMDFNLFLKSFELISTKLYHHNDLDQAMIIFFDNNLKKLFEKFENEKNDKEEILQILGLMRNNETIKLIKFIHPVLLIHYENYCDHLGNMDFEMFFKFFKDFQIFPDFVSIIQSKTIFLSLSEIMYNHHIDKLSNDANNNEKKTKEQLMIKDVINFDLFLDALAISSNFTKNKNLSGTDKLLNLLEKMNESKGISSSLKRNGSTFNTEKDIGVLLEGLKEFYPDYFESKQRMKMFPISFKYIFDLN